MANKEVILLVRVSTQHQDYTAQIKEVKKWAKRNNFTHTHLIAEKESAIKLSEEERNGINEMKEYISKHPSCKDVVVWELSRLARTEKVLFSLKEYFIKNKINLHVLQENITLLDENGEETSASGIMFSVYAHFCSQEMKLKKQRIGRSIALRGSQGKQVTNKPKLGYTTDANGYIIIDEKESEIIRKIYQMYATEKFSLMTLQKELEEQGYKYSFERIRTILSDKSYIGECCKRNKLAKIYPIIIEKEMFDKCQEIKKNNLKEKSKESKNSKIGNKLIKCHYCKRNFIYTEALKNRMYVCVSKKAYKNMGVEKCSESTSIDANIADEILYYCAINEDIEYYKKLTEVKTEEIEKENEILNIKLIAAQSDLNGIDGEYERINDMYQKGRLTASKYDEKCNSIDAKKNNLKIRIKEINKQIGINNKFIKDSANISIVNDINKLRKDIKLIFDKIEVKDVVKMVHERLDAAYVEKFESDTRKFKCFIVVTSSKKIRTFIVDNYARNKYVRYIELTDKRFNSMAYQSIQAMIRPNDKISKDDEFYDTPWIVQEITTNFKDVRELIKPFQDKIKGMI